MHGPAVHAYKDYAPHFLGACTPPRLTTLTNCKWSESVQANVRKRMAPLDSTAGKVSHLWRDWLPAKSGTHGTFTNERCDPAPHPTSEEPSGSHRIQGYSAALVVYCGVVFVNYQM